MSSGASRASSASGRWKQSEARGFIVLAAGHGTRIKSSLPKVVHSVWGIPSVVRVLQAAGRGFKCSNQVLVVGKQHEKVMTLIEAHGQSKQRRYAYQAEQNGTGAAVQVALEQIPNNFQGALFVLPGDIGIIEAEILRTFSQAFIRQRAEMMLLTGHYSGDPMKNYYGRIVRVPAVAANGQPTPKPLVGRVMAIVQYQDILALGAVESASSHKKKLPPAVMHFCYGERKYGFTREELLRLPEFDSGIFAFSAPALKRHIKALGSNNAQQEIYLTDLVKEFNQSGLKVSSLVCENNEALLGFNDKTVRRQLEAILRKRYYAALKNLIDIEDESKFFIHEKVIKKLLEQDRKSGPLDLHLGAGSQVGEEVSLGKGVFIGDNVRLSGKITLKDEVHLGNNTQLSNFANQEIVIEKGAFLEGNNVIQGQVKIGRRVRLAKSTNVTGSIAFPTEIKADSVLKGTCYLFGCRLEKESEVESSVLVRKRVKCRKDKNGKVKPVRFVLPQPAGTEALSEL